MEPDSDGNLDPVGIADGTRKGDDCNDIPHECENTCYRDSHSCTGRPARDTNSSGR